MGGRVMVQRFVRVVTLFIFISYRIHGDDAWEESKIRQDISLQVCFESFNIHKDKIIRTEDSRVLGAKYINEIDLDSRNECLRLCCETEKCDVFVFEEKSPGSCYLFDCGPPDDFKCKFTNHANFTSAVLTSNPKPQSSVELAEQIRRTQQDHEIESLRKLAESAPGQYQVAPSPTVSVATQPPQILTSPAPVTPKPVCSRNEFECRTSGDCIAIYNACDGIPQCTDGSDEGPELGCPTTKPPKFSPPIVVQPPISSPSDLSKYQQMNHYHISYPPVHGHQENNPRIGQPPPHQPASQREQPQYPQQVAVPQPEANLDSQMYQWDYQNLYDQDRGMINPVNPFRTQTNGKLFDTPYAEGQTRIFHHKGPGLVGETGEGRNFIGSNQQYVPPYPAGHASRPEKPKQEPPTTAPVHSTKPTPQLQPPATLSPVFCESHGEHSASKSDVGIESNQPDVQKKQLEKIPSPVDEKVKTQATDKTHHDVQESQKLSSEYHAEHKAAGVFVADSNDRTMNGVMMTHIHPDDTDNDMQPRSAMISLALGLTATAILSGLIACRLRVVRRRARRSHGPYAHDADYLVNGMYL